MNLDAYLAAVERWIPGPPAARAERLAEVRMHLVAAQSRGDLVKAMQRLGTPRDAARAFASPNAFRIASIGRRAAAYLADMAIIAAIAVALTGLVTLADVGNDAGLLAGLLGLAGWAFALVAIEYRAGRTPGKALLGLRVVSEDGIAPSFGEVVIRRLPLVFSGPLQVVDWCFAFAGERRQRAFDRLARTLVVRDEASSHARVANATA